MTEKVIPVSTYMNTDFWGVNDKKLNFLKILYPNLILIVRGEEFKIIGEKEDIDLFIEKFEQIGHYYSIHHQITEKDILEITGGVAQRSNQEPTNTGILRGQNGKMIKARTANQEALVKVCEKNDLVFAIGPAGSGKTYTAVALAVKAFRNKEVKKIVLTRPAVEAGEHLGFLPGDLKTKLDPYLQPLYDALHDMLPAQKLLYYREENLIEIAPLAFMRGRTLDNAYVILDEAQNATPQQLKMFLTRMGTNAKFIVTGDITQIDLPRNQKSGLVEVTQLLKNIEGIGFVFFDKTDIVRHPLVKKIIEAYEH